MSDPTRGVCNCTGPGTQTVHASNAEGHQVGCPRWGIGFPQLKSPGWPVAPEPTYQIEHQDWCYGVVHGRCCNLDSVDIDDCTCGAAEAQAEIDSLADTVRVQRAALDSIEFYADWVSTLVSGDGAVIADELRRRIRTAR